MNATSAAYKLLRSGETGKERNCFRKFFCGLEDRDLLEKGSS